ncbi:hypothetical protein WJX74_009379 [Apatococcus lobatus]|uniref:Cytochrome b5 heme-binding domain-containing protein n=1 Tax=Apatococcus lobatus TaxID=904363 RepID=A0AAW1QD93_9CHLO
MSEVTGKTGTSKEALAGKKVYSLSEAKEHTTEEDCWVVISGKVYDVTKFLDEHPGGYDIILTNTGQDATESFEEIGHSNAARELLNKYEIGEYEGGAAPSEKPSKKHAATAAPSAVDRIPVLKVLQMHEKAMKLNNQHCAPNGHNTGLTTQTTEFGQQATMLTSCTSRAEPMLLCGAWFL